jgi:hypothetical protein
LVDHIKKNEMGRVCNTLGREERCIQGHKGERRGAHRVLVGKLERKKPLVRPRHRWEVNIKMVLQEVEWGCMDWSNLLQDRGRW